MGSVEDHKGFGAFVDFEVAIAIIYA